MACPKCQGPLDPQIGRWFPTNPNATWGEGFWIGQPMVPWLHYEEILEKQRTYDLAQLKNEVLGVPTAMGDHVVSRTELEACCGDYPMVQTPTDIPRIALDRLTAGIDWGGGGVSKTVVVVGFLRPDNVFQVCYLRRLDAADDPSLILENVATICSYLNVRYIAADGGGNGHVFNPLLLERLPNHRDLHAVNYSNVDHPPKREGALMKWTVNRSATIGALFLRIKKRLILFPRSQESGTFLDEFACEVADYNDINRTVKYAHPSTQPDDALHACNYALLLAGNTFCNAAKFDRLVY